MNKIGYIPFNPCSTSTEAMWLQSALGCDVRPVCNAPSLNSARLPAYGALEKAASELANLNKVVAEGPGGFLWTAILRAMGFKGTVTILPYLNPRQWTDLAFAAVYRHFQDPGDRIFLGSGPSARIWNALQVNAQVGEPYGIDSSIFYPRDRAKAIKEELGIPEGRMLLFTGRVEADKNICRLLRVALRARLLFPDLAIVMASHIVDKQYMTSFQDLLDPDMGVHLVYKPSHDTLAALYTAADVFVTAATSHFETFGRAPAEALACGTPVVAPRYDGFPEVIDQKGGSLVDVDVIGGYPRVNEEKMLRAIYEVLSDPSPPSSAELADMAHKRVGRENTIHLLSHLIENHPPPAPSPSLASMALDLPIRWKQELELISALMPGDAIDRLWNNPDIHSLQLDNAKIRRGVCLNLFLLAQNKNKGGKVFCP